MPSYEETFTIGEQVRREIEISRGSTLVLPITVPGETAGKTFTATFKHHTYESSTVPTPAQGVDLVGSFLVTVLDGSRVQLSTATGTLLLGKYYYSIISTVTASGFVSSSSLREFNVIGTVTFTTDGPGVLPPQASLESFISAHNSDLGAHSAYRGTFSTTFSQADITLHGLLIRSHTLPQRPTSVIVYDESGYLVSPAAITATLSMVSLDLSDFTPINGSWLLVAAV